MRQLRKLIGLIRDNKAAAAIEYGLIAALIAICLLTALQHMATQTKSMWTMIKTKFAEAM